MNLTNDNARLLETILTQVLHDTIEELNSGGVAHNFPVATFRDILSIRTMIEELRKDGDDVDLSDLDA